MFDSEPQNLCESTLLQGLYLLATQPIDLLPASGHRPVGEAGDHRKRNQRDHLAQRSRGVLVETALEIEDGAHGAVIPVVQSELVQIGGDIVESRAHLQASEPAGGRERRHESSRRHLPGTCDGMRL
jgi:hypothetical protein